ncbi:MAG: glycosyltransferase [Lachnospiraceae bacterium]
MKIIQVLVTLSYGDGVGNDTIAIDQILKESGYDTKIYAENIDPRISTQLVEHISKIPNLAEEDTIIYHLSTGCELNQKMMKWNCKKIFRYHNVTPAEFFLDYDERSYHLCKEGIEQVAELKNTPDYVLADSEFNKTDLVEMGYTCPIDVVPILIPFDDYKMTADSTTMTKYSDGWTNIIFVGRVAPNKKHEDIIKCFSYYKKYVNPTSRLILVGSYNENDLYYQKLVHYVALLDVEDVIFTGHIKFEQILAYYRVGDLFLCMSEHEGFCIPLVEAMYFEVPIIAYESTAIPYTMQGIGAIANDKNPIFIAKLMDTILKNPKLKDDIVEQQKQVLDTYQYKMVKASLLSCLENVVRDI